MRKIAVGCALSAFLAVLLPVGACTGTPARGRDQYRIEAEYFPAERKIAGEAAVTLENGTDEALTALPFYLPANILRKGNSPVPAPYAPSAYYRGESYGGTEILSLEGAAGFSLNGEGSILTVSLGEPLFPDERLTLTFRFETSLAEINYRFGAGERAVNLAGFYPVLLPHKDGAFLTCGYAENGDPYVADCADYEVFLTLPKGYGVACGGGFTREEGESTVRFHITAEGARDFAAVLGEGMQRETRKAGGVTVEYCHFGDPACETVLNVAAESLAWYSERFGEYPWERYCLAQTGLYCAGLEYSALSLLSDSLRAEEIPLTVAHETAHQWWYASVGSDQFGCAWQDEGLAEFSAACFLDAHPAYGQSYRRLAEESENAYRTYFSVSTQLGGADRVMSRPLTSFSGPYEYRSVAYDEGFVLFDKVLLVSGEKRFFRALRRYAEEYAGKIASPAELIACFRSAGANVGALFDSFIEGRCTV